MKNLIQTTLLALCLLIVGSASAEGLDQYKLDGLVGERADGYVGMVQEEVPAPVAELVREINGKRRQEYQRIASANNLTLEQVQALAGKKAIERTRPGDWILLNGGWQKK
jgi:uncharacterized protein YdbL (DUF1318 family)